MIVDAASACHEATFQIGSTTTTTRSWNIKVIYFILVIYSSFSRPNTARGSGTSLVAVGPAKFKACKSILFTEGSPEVKIKNTWLMKLMFWFKAKPLLFLYFCYRVSLFNKA